MYVALSSFVVCLVGPAYLAGHSPAANLVGSIIIIGLRDNILILDIILLILDTFF